MANRLTMAKIQAIRGLHEQDWRNREIARELNIDRETVAKYVRPGGCISKLCRSPELPRLCSGELPTTWKEEEGFLLSK
jgi:IS30 family transposase